MINSQTIAKWGYNNEELDDLDAWTTEWQLVKLAGGPTLSTICGS